MKQANDAETVNLSGEPKRGRGRPRLENANSDGERARLYQARKKAELINKSDVTENSLPSYGMLESQIILLNSENMRLADELQAALDKIAVLEKEIKSTGRPADWQTVCIHRKSGAITRARGRPGNRSAESMGRDLLGCYR